MCLATHLHTVIHSTERSTVSPVPQSSNLLHIGPVNSPCFSLFSSFLFRYLSIHVSVLYFSFNSFISLIPSLLFVFSLLSSLYLIRLCLLSLFVSFFSSFSFFFCLDFLSFLHYFTLFPPLFSSSFYLSCFLFHYFIVIVCFFPVFFHLLLFVYYFSFTIGTTHSLPDKQALCTTQSTEFLRWFSLVCSSNTRRSGDGRRSVYRTSRRFCSLHSGGGTHLPSPEEEGAGPQHV